MSNVKKKDLPLIAISLVAILFIAATLSLFPQQSADAANTIFSFVTRMLGSAVQVLVLLAMGNVITYALQSQYPAYPDPVSAFSRSVVPVSDGCYVLLRFLR